MEIERDDPQIVARHARHRSVVRFDGTDETSRDAQLFADGWLVNGETRLTTPDKLTLPRGGVSVGSDRLSAGESATLADGDTVVVESPVVCLVRVDDGGEISVDERMRATLRPSGDVTVGWSRPPDAGVREISLPSRDAEGVASALRAATAVALPNVDTPDRTWPNSRKPAPSITESDRGTSPSQVERVDSGVELRLPDSLAAVASTATLAGYLGVEVTVGDTTEAELHAAGESWSLGRDPDTVDSRSSSWLRRVFTLDCHARAAGQHGSRLSGHDDAFEHVDGTADELYNLPLAERVARYLDDDSVDDTLPRWPETLHVEPRVDRLMAVTPQLCRLADVRLPRCERLELPDMVEYAPPSTEAVRGAADAVSAGRERVVPMSSATAATTGWSAAGAPMAAYGAPKDTLVSRRTDDTPLRVRVVECGGEQAERTTEKWRGALAPSVDLSVDTRPTVSRLCEVLRSDADVVHVAGHSGDDGVNCRDGSLSRVDLPASVAPGVVVWNACSSEPLAEETVARGAAASVGTTGPVPRDDARRDGAHYARLLSAGWCAERAARVLRRCYDPLGWVVHGDGAVRVQESSAGVPPLVVIDSDAETMTVDYSAPDSPGHWVTGLLSDSDRLCGRETYTLTDSRLEQVATRVDSPIVLDGDLVPPESLI